MSANVQEYEEVIVSDEEVKYKSLCQSQERHIERLERRIESLEEELASIGNRFVETVTTPINSNTTLPQGIQLPSELRKNIEQKLREKAIQKKEEVLVKA